MPGNSGLKLQIFGHAQVALPSPVPHTQGPSTLRGGLAALAEEGVAGQGQGQGHPSLASSPEALPSFPGGLSRTLHGSGLKPGR